jgi:predicted DCC family thiol-disulfide oxidoreductase YuxK
MAVSGSRLRETRWAAFRRRFLENYLTTDARSLGLGRIVLSVVLLVDLIRRVPDITLFYSNLGMVPNHMMMWRPPTQWMFSFFFLASWPDEVAVGFVICGFVYLALLVGWRTRIMQFLALICVLSLHGRVTLMENGGDWMLGELTLWTAFMPLGRRFSLDAVRASLRARRETTAAELEDRAALGTTASNIVISLAAFALVLQLADAYLFNALHKGGQTWRQGTAVHYVLHQDRIVTMFGVWMRPHMTLWLSRVLSWGSLATEALLPALLLSPVHKTWTRRVAILCVLGLHTGFQLFINLGVFSWTMISYTPFLLTAADWEWLARRGARDPRRLTAYFDAGCGVCFQIARLLARLDRFHRVRFVSSAEVPAGVDIPADMLERTIVVVDERTGRKTTRADAMAQILRVLPIGWLWSLPLRLPGLHALANWGYDLFAGRRQSISGWLGLAACALPPRKPPAIEAAPVEPLPVEPVPATSEIVAPYPGEPPLPAAAALPPSDVPAFEQPAFGPPPPPPDASRAPIREVIRRAVWVLREGTVLAFIITLVSETLFINAAVPQFLKHEQPLWIKRLVAYPRLIQAWSMFASDAPVTDQNLVVDAITVDGRHVDPYSEATGRYPNPGRSEIPVRLDNDSFVFNYTGRLPTNPAYHNAFTDWILRYPERTGNPNDKIVRFDAYEVDDDSPPPGQLQPRNVRSHVFLSYPGASR